MARRLVVAADAPARLAEAAAWLAAMPADGEALVVGATRAAADDLVREVAARDGARFGVERVTLGRLAVRLAAPALAREPRVPATPLAFAAVAARAVHRRVAERALGYFGAVAGRPGFAAAVAATLEELRLAGVEPDGLARLPGAGADLASLAEALDDALADAGLADRSQVLAAALAAVQQGAVPAVPLLLLDLPALSPREAALVRALVDRAPDVLATAPASDARAVSTLREVLRVDAEARPHATEPRALGALKTHLFGGGTPEPGELDESVSLRSWPGEARECIEIAREIQAAAARGVPFDRMAVFLHAPGSYTAHLTEALDRATIPAYFARGATRPHPAGRALLALLACAAEGLSARRFAEYLSLAQVPDAGASPDETWTPPEHALLPDPPVGPPDPPVDDVRVEDPDAAGVVAGTLRAPWRWERLLVDAAVIGGVDRWRRRLDGLAVELGERERDAEDEETAARIARTRADLGHLRDFALPLVGRLAALPARARWGEWLAALRDLTAAAVREPAAVLAALGELAPMGPVGPLDLDEVRLVLAPRLRELASPPPARRHGAVFVAPTDAARGLAFDVVFVPGLAEKVFPRKVVEDPLLLDAGREALGGGLATQADRVAAERLALHVAIGAARTRVVLSYPRIDVEQARPRVPSFYALEALQAVEGRLPGIDALAVRAAAGGGRLGWPAPDRSEDAVDEAEYDLALLAPLLDADPATTAGTARYLLQANAHLGRALRARARRWLQRWTPADGLVTPDAPGREALAAHQLSARSFSPTALQQFASCPYRFFLHAVHRLQPREEPVAVEALDALTRGAIFHEIQFEVLTRLRGDGALPVRPATLSAACVLLDEVVAVVTETWRERLAPAIPRVWDDGVAGLRADLREWLRRAAESDDGWVPDRFELSFGLKARERGQEDPASVRDPVPVVGALRLRGSIDLIERGTDGVLRATDHKTGKVWAKEDVVVGGGEVLQPVLYALAAESLLGGRVEAGRLYYCTADGGYTERVVPLDEQSRAAAATVADVVGRAVADGFLPAAPARGACRRCDYRVVCGPYEEQRVRRKPADRLADIEQLRGMR